MIRDTRRDNEYFTKWADFLEKSLLKRKERLPTLTDIGGIAFCVNDLFSQSLELCIMKYSRGDKIESFKQDVMEVIKMRRKMIRTIDNLPKEEESIRHMYSKLTLYAYTEFFTLFSFLHYLGADKAEFKESIDLFDYLDKDTILNRVSELLTGSSNKTTDPSLLAYRKIYTPLLKVFNAADDDRPALMKKFVEGWYKSMKPAAWHDTDIDGGEGSYIGYWCFEAALVVNLLNIDDSSFRDNVYYPKDLIVRK